MKRWHWIALTIVALPLVIVGILYAMGGQTQTYRAEVMIEAPPGEVFPYLTEPDRIQQWVKGVTEIKPLTEGGHRVGAKAISVVEEEGQRYEFTDEVIATTPDELLEINSTSDIFDADLRWELEPVESGTHLTVVMKARFRGFFRLLAPMMRSAAEDQLRTDFDTLKQLIESPPPEPVAPTDPPIEEPMPEPEAPAGPNLEDTTDWMMT